MTDDVVVRARGLVKRFGDFTAVDGIDLEIHRGEIFGFLGPNGAGKTTTIKMLTTLSRPTEGTVEIEGKEVEGLQDPVKKGLGILQQHISLDKDVTVEDNIRYHAILNRIPRDEIPQRMKDVVELLALEPYLKKMVINLSGGWQRRVGIACSLIHSPSILFLDEPTAGLDTQSRHMLWKVIGDLNSDGKTVMITTHYMDEAEELCDRVAIINKGRMIALGRPSELCESLGAWAVEWTVNGEKCFRYFGTKDEQMSFQETLPEGCRMISRTTNLEDVFLELTGRDVQATTEVKFRI